MSAAFAVVEGGREEGWESAEVEILTNDRLRKRCQDWTISECRPMRLSI